jgi:hypothetical protein
VSCQQVRDLLPELAIGVLPGQDRERLERHLASCAGCRKEAVDLEQAAATLALALPPAQVPAGLAGRVVSRVRRATGAPGTGRRARSTVAALVAAALVVASLGWGVVMAGRADRFADRAERAERQQAAALVRFQRVLARVIPGEDLSPNETYLGRLSPAASATGGGAVLQLVSPTLLDFVIVIVNGLDPAQTERLPYRVQLVNSAGDRLRAGRITELDADGGAEVFHQFRTRPLDGYTTVNVVDTRGEIVLSGTVERAG